MTSFVRDEVRLPGRLLGLPAGDDGRADAALAAVREALRDPPYPKQFIAVGTRTVNRQATDVFLSWTEEGGGWHQWSTSLRSAKPFSTEEDALRAVRSCPGPWMNEPDPASVKVVAVENKKSASYLTAIAASPLTDPRA